MTEPQDVDALRRRGRRRLVGAIALVLLAVIVLPMVFDQEPKQTASVNVRIPSEEQGGLAPQAPAKPGAVPGRAAAPGPAAAPAAAAPPAPAPAAAPKPAPEVKPEAAKPAQAPDQQEKPDSAASGGQTATPSSAAEHARAEAALAGKEYIVPVAALAEQQRVRALTARLRAARLPYYTEAINTKHGKVTRVRVGPFDGREAAERAHEKLQKLGLRPGPVAIKS